MRQYLEQGRGLFSRIAVSYVGMRILSVTVKDTLIFYQVQRLDFSAVDRLLVKSLVPGPNISFAEYNQLWFSLQTTDS